MARAVRNSAKVPILSTLVEISSQRGFGAVKSDEVATRLGIYGMPFNLTDVQMNLMRYARHGLVSRTREDKSYRYTPNKRTHSTLQYLRQMEADREFESSLSDDIMLAAGDKNLPLKERTNMVLVFSLMLGARKMRSEPQMGRAFTGMEHIIETLTNALEDELRNKTWKDLALTSAIAANRAAVAKGEEELSKAKRDNDFYRMFGEWALIYLRDLWAKHPELEPKWSSQSQMDSALGALWSQTWSSFASRLARDDPRTAESVSASLPPVEILSGNIRDKDGKIHPYCLVVKSVKPGDLAVVGKLAELTGIDATVLSEREFERYKRKRG